MQEFILQIFVASLLGPRSNFIDSGNTGKATEPAHITIKTRGIPVPEKLAEPESPHLLNLPHPSHSLL